MKSHQFSSKKTQVFPDSFLTFVIKKVKTKILLVLCYVFKGIYSRIIISTLINYIRRKIYLRILTIFMMLIS